MGLPASEEVGALAKILVELRIKVEDYLGTPIESVGVTVPDLIALYSEDLQDAFEYVRLRYLSFPVRYDILYETSAAYAGYGLGLCSDYIDRVGCKKEQQDMPSEVIMAVSYTRTVLTVTLSIVKSACYLYEPVNRRLTNFSLGYDAREELGSGYWNEVSFNLEKIMMENPYYKRPSKIVLMGDCTDEEKFLMTLDRVLGKYVTEAPELLNDNPMFVAAKGVAEMAKRLPYDPYKTSYRAKTLSVNESPR